MDLPYYYKMLTNVDRNSISLELGESANLIASKDPLLIDNVKETMI